MKTVDGNHRDRAKALMVHISKLPRDQVQEALAQALFEVEKKTAIALLIPVMNKTKDEAKATMNLPKRKALQEVSESIKRQLQTDWGMVL